MRKGFTLAEVLITLVIVGIVAAITVTAMIKDSQQKEYNTAFKKSLSSLNRALKMDKALYGSIIGGDNGGELADIFANNLTTVNRVNLSSGGRIVSRGAVTDAYSDTGAQIYTADGIMLMILGTSASCQTQSEMIADLSNASCKAQVDVNGDASPNVAGKDIFNVVISQSSVSPGDDDARNALFAQ